MNVMKIPTTVMVQHQHVKIMMVALIVCVMMAMRMKLAEYVQVRRVSIVNFDCHLSCFYHNITTDIDDCQTVGICSFGDHDTVCMNTPPGSYTCNCPDGTQGNGGDPSMQMLTCVGMSVCTASHEEHFLKLSIIMLTSNKKTNIGLLIIILNMLSYECIYGL